MIQDRTEQLHNPGILIVPKKADDSPMFAKSITDKYVIDEETADEIFVIVDPEQVTMRVPWSPDLQQQVEINLIRTGYTEQEKTEVLEGFKHPYANYKRNSLAYEGAKLALASMKSEYHRKLFERKERLQKEVEQLRARLKKE